MGETQLITRGFQTAGQGQLVFPPGRGIPGSGSCRAGSRLGEVPFRQLQALSVHQSVLVEFWVPHLPGLEPYPTSGSPGEERLLCVVQAVASSVRTDGLLFPFPQILVCSLTGSGDTRWSLEPTQLLILHRASFLHLPPAPPLLPLDTDCICAQF